MGQSSRTGTAVAVIAAAACMRSAITALGPLLPLIRRDTGLFDTELGLLGALPLLAFAAVSPLVAGPSRRLGPERLVALALGVLALGTVIRSLPALAALWIGTAVLGGAIAVCNVVLPSIVKRDFADRITLLTGCYTSVMSGLAAVSSGIALPLADALGDGWRWSLGIWAVPAALGAALWWARRRPAVTPAPAAADGPSVWRNGRAWAITAYMGLQSTSFYVLVSWLPSIMTSHGTSASAAGWYLFAYQLIGLLAGLALPLLTGRIGTGATSVAAGLPLVVACAGIVASPGLLPLWVVLAGISSGASLVAALSLIGLAAGDPAHAVGLSGMAQSLGYLLAAAGPVVAGSLHDATGAWTAVVLLLGAIGLAQVGAAAAAGVAGRRERGRTLAPA